MEILPFTGYHITMLIISIILDVVCPFCIFIGISTLVSRKYLKIFKYGEFLQIS